MTELEIAAAVGSGAVAGVSSLALWLRKRMATKRISSTEALLEKVCEEQLEKEERRKELPAYDHGLRVTASEQRFIRFAGQEKVAIPIDLRARINEWFKKRGK